MQRTVLAVAVLCIVALTALGCHDGYSTYQMGVSADYRWNDDDCHQGCAVPYRAHRVPSYPPPRHGYSCGRGY